jgi:deoxyribodipyrimidine photo-lyase
MTSPFIPTREAARLRLETFLPQAARYSFQRNFVTIDPQSVSALSPYIRCRLLSEAEVCRSVLRQHPFESVEKFIQEVCWRTYWKGWLELHPGVWDAYRTLLDAWKTTLPEGYHSACNAETGIECFDHWVRELKDSNYLHNHARMWFASIWIFTLKLPWELGADFFYRHLLDADPASNTLSWRWVAGLQTVGKHYLARAGNIRKYTDGRFNPAGQLDENAPPLPPEPPADRVNLPPASSLPEADGIRRGLLVLGDDLSPETALPPSINLHGIAGGPLRDFPAESAPATFLCHAFEDAAGRLENRFQCPYTPLSPEKRHSDIQKWVANADFDEILLLSPPVGPWKDDLKPFRFPVPVRQLRRDWDTALYPNATAGFFRFKNACITPGCLNRLVTAQP